MSRTALLLLSLFFIILFVPQICTGDDYATWSGSQQIILNTTPEGSNISNNVLNFPVLIRLNPGNFDYFSQTLAGGADIRFAKTDDYISFYYGDIDDDPSPTGDVIQAVETYSDVTNWHYITATLSINSGAGTELRFSTHRYFS